MELHAHLVHAESGRRVVEVRAWEGDRPLGSALGEAADAEAAEDRARQRLLARLGPGQSTGAANQLRAAEPAAMAAHDGGGADHGGAEAIACSEPPRRRGESAVIQPATAAGPSMPKGHPADPEDGDIQARGPWQNQGMSQGQGSGQATGAVVAGGQKYPVLRDRALETHSAADTSPVAPIQPAALHAAAGTNRSAQQPQVRPDDQLTGRDHSPDLAELAGADQGGQDRDPGPASLASNASPLETNSDAWPKTPSAAAMAPPQAEPSAGQTPEPPQEPPPDPEDWSSDLAALDLQLRRLGWDREREAIYLQRAFGHPNRNRLTNYGDLRAYLYTLAGLASGTEAATAPVPLRRSELLSQCDALLAQLGWNADQGRSFLERELQAASRQQLNDQQLLHFNMLLESEMLATTPGQAPVVP